MEWIDWRTALKPASEHWILIQKPISEQNVAQNVLKYRTGGLNVEASRFGSRRKYPNNFLITKSLENCPSQVLEKQGGVSSSIKAFEAPFYYASRASRKERFSFNTHSTVKPLKLMRYLCEMITPPGGRVLDPFMGSGTTGVACLEKNFSFTGIEQDKAYFSIAQRRLEESKNLQKKSFKKLFLIKLSESNYKKSGLSLKPEFD